VAYSLIPGTVGLFGILDMARELAGRRATITDVARAALDGVEAGAFEVVVVVVVVVVVDEFSATRASSPPASPGGGRAGGTGPLLQQRGPG
jgi:hypothetical protein